MALEAVLALAQHGKLHVMQELLGHAAMTRTQCDAQLASRQVQYVARIEKILGSILRKRVGHRILLDQSEWIRGSGRLSLLSVCPYSLQLSHNLLSAVLNPGLMATA